MSDEIKITMGGDLDENDCLVDRGELNKRIKLKDEEIEKLRSELTKRYELLREAVSFVERAERERQI